MAGSIHEVLGDFASQGEARIHSIHDGTHGMGHNWEPGFPAVCADARKRDKPAAGAFGPA